MTVPALRAIARLAWRQTWRARGRSLLVVSMVAVPIAGLAFAAIAIRTGTPTESDVVADRLGTAALSVDWHGPSVEDQVRALLPAGSRLTPRGFLPPDDPIVQEGAVYYVGLTEYGAAIDRPPMAGWYRVVDGRVPSAPGEVALHPDLLPALGVGIGDAFVPREGVELRITGTIERTSGLNDRAHGVLGPGTLASIGKDRSGALIELPTHASPSHVRSALEALGGVDEIEDPQTILAEHRANEGQATAGAFAGAAIVLLGTGSIAGAAIAVSARRQLRILGLVGAAGADRRHIRAAVLLGGTLLGAVGSVCGIAIGVVATHALRPQIDRLAGRVLGPVELPWGVLAGAALLGIGAATLAAYGPARSAARLSVLQALAGRTPAPKPPGRIAAKGAIAVGVGAVITALGARDETGLVLTAGLVTMLVGFLVAIPLLVSWSGRLATVLPTFARIALRDVARNGRRTGAAMAAGTVALALPVAVATLTLADEAGHYDHTPMAEDHLVLNGFGTGRSGSDAVRRAGAAIVEAFPGSTITGVVPAVVDGATSSQPERLVLFHATVVSDAEGTSWTQDGLLVIGDAATLRTLHAEDGIPALERGELVALGPGTVTEDTVDLFVDGTTSPLIVDEPVVVAGEERYEGFGWGLHVVIAPDRAAELGLRPSGRGSSMLQLVVRTPEPLDEAGIERARRIVAAERSVAVNTRRDYLSDGTAERTVFTLAGMAIALAVVAVVVALVSAESRRDRAILVAVGAGPQARRAVAAASAAAVGALSGVLAVVAGFVPSVVYLLAREQDVTIAVPWAVAAAVVLGVPAVAGAFGSLVARQPKAAALLRPIA